MEDARRFFRYIIPGLTFGIELTLYFLISHQKLIYDLFKIIVESKIATGVTLAGIFISGGIGFLLSQIHHVFYWAEVYFSFGLAGDHRPMLRSAESANYLKYDFADENGVKEIKRPELSRAAAWRVVTALWHERVKLSEEIKGANPRTDSLSDLMHGSGAMLVGAIVAFMVWVIVLFSIFEKDCYPLRDDYWLLTIILFVVVFGVHLCSYHRIVQNAQGVVDKILLGVLRKERANCGIPVIAIIAEQDFTRSHQTNLQGPTTTGPPGGHG